jgi:hypothetical protein
MSTDMMLFGNNSGPMQLPAHLQGQGLGVGTARMAAIGDMRNRIGLKGNRFRQIIAGQEMGVWDENYLDVIIVGVVPTVSRIFYKDKFKQTGDNAPPTCFSVDNVAPPIDLPTRQSDKCALCPQNIKGSSISDDGHEGKACGYFRRLAVMLPGDKTLYVIDIKAMGLFGESYKERGLFSLNDYAKFLNASGVDASNLVTRISFDTAQSVPKVMFKAARYITAEELMDVRAVADSGEVNEYLTINFKTIDISKESGNAPVAEDVAAYDPDAQAVYEQDTQTQQAPPPRQAAPAPRQAAPAAQAPRQAAPAPQRQTAPAQTAPAQRQAAPAQQAPAQRAPAQTAPAQRQAAPTQTAPAQRQTAPAARQAAPTKPAAPAPTRPSARPQQQQFEIDNGVTQEDTLPVEVGSDAEMAGILDELGLS